MQMKNKSILYLAIIVVLGAITYLQMRSNENFGPRSDRRDFAIADTSKVTKVILTSKFPEVAIIERQSEDSWLLNDKYKARKSAVYYLLQTIHRMEIAHPVPLSMRENVLGNLAVKGIKIEVFMEGGNKKTFYVGGENQQLTATFMMLQNSSEPYALHIPGFKGYLSGRFFTQEHLWRDKLVMSFDNREIAEIQMEFFDPNERKESFSIQLENEDYVLRSLKEQEILKADSSSLISYLASFRKLYSEGFISDYDALNTDSLLKATPYFELNIKNKKGKEVHLRTFYKKARPGTEINGELVMRDPDRYFAQINNNDIVLIQKNSFKKIIKGLSYLQGNPIVKK